ncbi:pentapeptide repeat-containing protein [Tateyamaria sp. syn59]|uniref:AfsR/SARP family transcriptional regulator n=1 Tax=Tateyamaria sp. syn59 TaxID=2576942 RepID=UPI0011BDF938|nr:pentapeptide repeat-containing protein [Tateyamaria sp. syn59]
MKHIRLSEFETEAVLGILEGDASDPIALVLSVGLDPKVFFEFGDWRDVDFRKSNIDLASFVGADLTNAIFDQEQVAMVERRFGFSRDRLRVLQPGEAADAVPTTNQSRFTSSVDIRLIGPFRITSKDGKDLTPRGAKSRAILALLATSPGYQRSRVWLQDKLWSMSASPQASASLRQALLEIRRALGEYAYIINADRLNVSLTADKITVDVDSPNPEVVARTFEEAELLEGIDVKDPEFEDWLREVRMRFEVNRSNDS